MLHCPKCGQEFAEEVRVCPEDGALLKADETVAMNLPADPLIGRTLDEKYRLDALLGTGGMGTVYRATHLLIDRPVAIKVLNPRYVEDEAAQTRFRREARAAGRLQHANAVTVTDFGTTSDGLVYIVMELLEGRTLRDLLAREAPLDTARAVSIMLQISAAVGAAHEAGIIHRDLKPANIFIVQRKDAPTFVKVLDFGIAKLAAEVLEDDDDPQTITQLGTMIGTPRYMSPEQSEGAKLTPASDVYSLGIILYEMLTGTTPFTGTSPIAIAIKHASMPPRSPREFVVTIPPSLEAVVMHALDKRPEERPANANAFRNELFAVAERLGLEHAESLSKPSIETLRSAGTETPSGRLVIDIERLREQRAASNASPAAPAPSAAVETVQQPKDVNTAQPHMPSTAYAAPVASAPPYFSPPPPQPAIARFRIFLGGRQQPGARRGLRTVVLLLSAVILIAGLVVTVIAMRSGGKLVAASNVSETLSRTTIFADGNGDESADNDKKSGARQNTHTEREPRRVAPRPKPQQPSKVKQIFHKIFRNPF